MEALQKMSDAKLVDCPECSASALKKQVTAAAFKLKGTGWYETDFKNSGAKPEPTKTDKADKSANDKSAGSGSSADNGPQSASAEVSSKPDTNVVAPKKAASTT